MLVKNKQPMTLEEFEQLTENNNETYELFEGVVMMTPRPNFAHQRISGNLFLLLGNHFSGKQCSPITETEIQLDDNILVPDIFIYCDSSKVTEQRHIGAPTITIEILSPSTAYNDHFKKFNLYAKYGVQEYWIVNPTAEIITIHHFINERTKEYGKIDTLTSDVFNDLSIKLSDIFSE